MSTTLCVIAPSYNHEEYIEECLQSVIDSAEGNFLLDIIVIDDCSMDRTAEIAETFLKNGFARNRLRRSRVIRNTYNKGAHANYNEAIRLCDADVIHFMNTDDAIGKERLKAVAEAYAETVQKEDRFTFWGFGPVNLIDERSRIFVGDGFWQYLTHVSEYSARHLPSMCFHLLRDNLAISTGNIFVSRDLAERLNGFGPYLYVHDWDFILRCLLFSEPRMLQGADLQYLYRHHPGNTFKKLGHIGHLESHEVLYRFYRNAMSGRPVNKNLLSIANYGSDLFWAWLAQNPDHEQIAKRAMPAF